jgi:hypothetical protein
MQSYNNPHILQPPKQGLLLQAPFTFKLDFGLRFRSDKLSQIYDSPGFDTAKFEQISMLFGRQLRKPLILGETCGLHVGVNHRSFATFYLIIVSFKKLTSLINRTIQ